MASVSTTPSTIPHKKSSWKLDPVHSRIEFSIRHLMISTVKGCFNQYDGLVDWDEEDLTLSSVVAHIDTTSIYSGDEYRDQHLRSPEFLHVEDHPELTFKSTRIERVSDEDYHIYGDLTFHGVTKEVKLDTTYGGRGVNPASGQTVAGFEARTTINRKDFGMSFNMVLDTGGLALGDNIKVEINAELVLLDEPEASS
jgi:polyisoprenoid-binding protein YceI